MLYFYDARIYYNLELGTINNPYYATHLPFCDDDQIETQFDNVKRIDMITQEQIESGDYSEAMILLTPGEFRGFVQDYVKHCNVNKLYGWDGYSFFYEYYNMMKNLASVGAEQDYHGRWCDDDSFYNTILTSELVDMELPEAETSPIVISYECKPELSMRIEDALYAVKNNGTSLYTQEAIELVQANLKKLRFTKSLYKKFFGLNCDFGGLDLFEDTEFTSLSDIDFSQDSSILYFYYYSFLPGVRTNVAHLKKVMEAMK